MRRFVRRGGDRATRRIGAGRMAIALDLSSSEVDDIVAFLETLTGEPIPLALREDTAKL